MDDDAESEKLNIRVQPADDQSMSSEEDESGENEESEGEE